jgi:sugar lactone lactonase YvrE
MSLVKKFHDAQVLVRGTDNLGEAPIIDPRTSHLLWVDMTDGIVNELDLTNNFQTKNKFNHLISAIAPRESMPGFACAVKEGFGFVVNGELHIAERIHSEEYLRMNDAKVDGLGRYWGGSNHIKYLPNYGKVHCWDGETPSRVMLENLILPNGLAWSPDNSFMYLADSYLKCVFKASFDLDDGQVGKLEKLINIADGYPDGMAIDLDGCIWIAIWGEAVVQRYDGNGNLIGIVPLPVSQPTSCAFGQSGLLYITSAREGLPADQLLKEPLAGSIFVLQTGTSGVPIHSFRG